jgi:hypothetical protein
MILIAGDSWGAGEWPKSGNIPLHAGVSQYFVEQGYQITNLSKPGGSNLESIDRLKDYLRCNQHQIPDIKFILFWQTEFFREIWYYRKRSIFGDIESELGHGYAKLKDHWIYRPYRRLAELYQQWNIPIRIIGGCSDTVWYDDFENDFSGVKIVCQSATNLLSNSDHRIDTPVFCQFLNRWIDEGDFLNTIKKNISNQDLEILLQDMSLGQQRTQLYLQRSDLFYPDGCHPNRHAHKIIFDFLCKNIPELQK